MTEYLKWFPFYFSLGVFLALSWGVFTMLKEIWIELAKQTKLKELELGITEEMKKSKVGEYTRAKANHE